MIEFAVVSPEAMESGRAWYDAILVRERDRVALVLARASLRELELAAEQSFLACEQARRRFDRSQQPTLQR